MSIYKKCIEFKDETTNLNTFNNSVNLIIKNEDISTLPECLKKDELYFQLCKSCFYISDIHLEDKIFNKYSKNTNDLFTKRYIKKLAKSLFSKELIYQIENMRENPIVLFLGDIAFNYEISKIFYKEFIKTWNIYENNSKYTKNKNIYVVLGNHEFWNFENIKDCYETYSKFFNEINIKLLNNNIIEFPFFNLVGATGFAGKNEYFNADNGLYKNALKRKEEIIETIKWNDTYKRALLLSKEQKRSLIVATHNPIEDWNMLNAKYEPDCIYFYGHNHKNYIEHIEENNTHIYADNQIGYLSKKKNQIEFKEAKIYREYNPFAKYQDGYYQIERYDYLMFNKYMGIMLNGTKKINHQIETVGEKFYMVKKSGYYGFFLISQNECHICSGGNITRIKDGTSIEEIYNNFLQMINAYIKVFSPYRAEQEKISALVKSFGGDGKIHSYIIDIDFYNHIMLLPNGKYIYYHSPIYGLIYPYKNLLSLLESHNKVLLEEYKNKMSNKESILPISDIKEKEPIIVDIKNSIYSTTVKVNQVQRLFEQKILRVWNEFLISSPHTPLKYEIEIKED